jgi:ElaB/YqjD/DUF883 family membrane-anchored ribosome-binding protein
MDTSGKLNSLMRETEELLERIADERAPHIQRVRERLQQSLEQTKSAIEDEVENGKANGGRPQQHVGVRDLAGSLNDYVRRYPWLALATGVLVASSIGILATHATKRSYNHGS